MSRTFWSWPPLVSALTEKVSVVLEPAVLKLFLVRTTAVVKTEAVEKFVETLAGMTEEV